MRHSFRTFAPAVALSLAVAVPSAAEQAKAIEQKAKAVEQEATAVAPQANAPAPAAAPTEKLDAVTREQAEADRGAQASQQRINALDDETQKLLSEYRKALADTESHKAYTDQLSRQIQSQESELGEIERQLGEIEETSRSITPLEQKMLATLEQFVALDVPFLAEERAARVRTLKEMMDRADVSISEKYRRIVEAYQVELDYGRTIEAYDANMQSAQKGEGSERTASFLRIGRVALLYQTLDGRETGYWDQASRMWKVDNAYAHSFQEGVKVAKKQSAPEMLVAPVPAPVEAAPEVKS